MFTHKDIELRSIFVINCIDHERSLKVADGELLLEENAEGSIKTLTKFPFQKLLALFVIGHITVTTPLIDKCKRYGVALVVMKPNLRPVFFWADAAEGNFLLRQRQYNFAHDDLSVARSLMISKITNQRRALLKTRRKDDLTAEAEAQCKNALNTLNDVTDYNQLMGVEGIVSKHFLAAYFQDHNWHGRHPRMRDDALNTTLDIGYTILFNFIECNLRLFGFDLYVGVYHRLWYKRKSLVCDLVEPFRCLIDHATLLAFNRKQFTAKDFVITKNEYRLRHDRCADYYRVFYNSLIERRMEIFAYIQQYYRCFMGQRSASNYPQFVF